ncbi:MAG: YecA family protein [Burkholderiaceae bacterium]|jgi:uncharacterized protein|nr:YecA family protein [Burkholderiaceae bacterium]
MSNKNTPDPSPDFDLEKFLNGTDISPKLDDQQFETLELFMEQHPNGMHMEILDGFFCGLICGPHPAGPDEFIPYIFGGSGPKYQSPAQAEEIRNFLNQHWDYVKDMIKSQETYYPVLYSDNDFKVSANDWAFGFVLGLDKYRESWNELLELSQKEEHLLTPILTLYLETSPENKDGPIHAEDREEIISTMVNNLPQIYNHFSDEREKNSQNLSH